MAVQWGVSIKMKSAAAGSSWSCIRSRLVDVQSPPQLPVHPFCLVLTPAAHFPKTLSNDSREPKSSSATQAVYRTAEKDCWVDLAVCGNARSVVAQSRGHAWQTVSSTTTVGGGNPRGASSAQNLPQSNLIYNTKIKNQKQTNKQLQDLLCADVSARHFFRSWTKKINSKALRDTI